MQILKNEKIIGSIRFSRGEAYCFIEGENEQILQASLSKLEGNTRLILDTHPVELELECVCPDCGEVVAWVDPEYAIEWPKSKNLMFEQRLDEHICARREEGGYYRDRAYRSKSERRR